MTTENQPQETSTTTDVEADVLQTTEEAEKTESVDWKTLAKKWEKRATANFKEVNSLKEQTAGVKSIEERIKAMEEENFNLKRAQVASKYNIPEALVSRLQGKNADELEADAKGLSEILGKKPDAGKQSASQKNVPLRMQGGEAPTNTVTKVSNKDDFNAAIKAQKS